MVLPTPRLPQASNGHDEGTSASPTVRDEPHLLVAMSLDQANAAIAALDLFSRLAIGQLEKIAEFVSMGEVPMRSESNEPRKTADVTTVGRIEDLMNEAKLLMGYQRGGSNGIGHTHNTMKSLRAYELKRVIALAISTRPESTTPSFSVDRDRVTVRYTKDMLAQANWVSGI